MLDSVTNLAALLKDPSLLVTKAYFLMGGLPLLVLAHDTPMDGKFIRRFFEVDYTVTLVAAAGATAGYAWWGHPLFAAGTTATGAWRSRDGDGSPPSGIGGCHL